MPEQPIGATRRAIIAGFGPVGRFVAEGLERNGFEITVVDLNPRTIETLHQQSKLAVLGDIREEAVLRQAGIEQAESLVLTIPDEDQALAACEIAHRLRPHCWIVARTNFLSRGMLARGAGADHVVVEEVVTAEAMHRAVVGHLCGLQCTPQSTRDEPRTQ